MNNYDLIESYLDELIDRIKSMRDYARDEEYFFLNLHFQNIIKSVEIDGVYHSSFDSVYHEIREIMREVRNEL